jgi:hypothetical protein
MITSKQDLHFINLLNMIIQISHDSELMVTTKHAVIFHFLRKFLNKGHISLKSNQRLGVKDDYTANCEVPGCSTDKVNLYMCTS